MKCTKCDQEFSTSQFTQALIHFESHKGILDYKSFPFLQVLKLEYKGLIDQWYLWKFNNFKGFFNGIKSISRASKRD